MEEPRNLTKENVRVLDSIGYVRPRTAYTESPLPGDFNSFLISAGAGAAVGVWSMVPGAYICGGAVRAYHNWKANLDDTEVRDIDMYFVNSTAVILAANVLTALGYTEVASTERARTFLHGDKPAIQLVKFVYGTIEAVLNEFDYTIVKAGATPTTMVKHTDYDTDLKNRVLRYYGSRLPMASLSRAIKYARYGYKLPAKDMVAMLMDIRRTVDFENPLSVTYHVASFDPTGNDASDAIEAVF